MATFHPHGFVRMTVNLLLFVGILHAMERTIISAEARDCGCIAAGKWTCGIDGKWYSSMCQAMCNGVQGGYNKGGCDGIQECEEACLGRMTLRIKPGAPDYCWPICPFPPYPPIGYNVKVDGPDVCKTYRKQCYAVCAATRLNPVWKFTKEDNFFDPCYHKCCDRVGC